MGWTTQRGNMQRYGRIIRLTAGAAGVAAVAAVAASTFPSGATQTAVAPTSVPSLTSLPVPHALPSGSQCVSTPATPSIPSPVTASGGGSLSSPAGGGSVTASSS